MKSTKPRQRGLEVGCCRLRAWSCLTALGIPGSSPWLGNNVRLDWVVLAGRVQHREGLECQTKVLGCYLMCHRLLVKWFSLESMTTHWLRRHKTGGQKARQGAGYGNQTGRWRNSWLGWLVMPWIELAVTGAGLEGRTWFWVLLSGGPCGPCK